MIVLVDGKINQKRHSHENFQEISISFLLLKKSSNLDYREPILSVVIEPHLASEKNHAIGELVITADCRLHRTGDYIMMISICFVIYIAGWRFW